MMVMMVVMMMSMGVAMLYVAVLLVAVLAFFFELKGGVAYAVLSQLLSHLVLDMVRMAVGDHVHGGVITLPVHAPDVDVVNVYDTFDLAKMLLYFVNIHTVGGLFKKKIQNLFEIFDGVHKNEYCHADGHYGVY